MEKIIRKYTVSDVHLASNSDVLRILSRIDFSKGHVTTDSVGYETTTGPGYKCVYKNAGFIYGFSSDEGLIYLGRLTNCYTIEWEEAFRFFRNNHVTKIFVAF